MSGIAGVFHLDSAAPDRELASQMAQAIEFRGPHATGVWTGEAVFFVHTLLKTTYEAENEKQPTTLDGKVWITADARIDAREDLVRELKLQQSALSRPDCELILHAYARWGEKCVEHLLGDFAFAIWDRSRRKLFCARDQFGVKPFFYSLAGQALVFSNTLDCVRLHPNVSGALNELAIADFLIFDYNQDLSTTTFRQIRRLPPAHTLTVNTGGTFIRRYWSLPQVEPIRYRCTRDYVEHFRFLMGAAVRDRLRLGRVAMYMSGGLDSTSVAAFASRGSAQTKLKAFTCVRDWLIKDEERHFAGLAAEGLAMEIEYLPWDEPKPFGHVLLAPSPEPTVELFRKAVLDDCQHVASYARVALTGHGSDAQFSTPMLSWASVKAIPYGNFALNCANFILDQKAIPRFRLRSALLSLLNRDRKTRRQIPAWLNGEFLVRCNIRERVDGIEGNGPDTNQARHSARTYLLSRFWPWLWETEYDAGWNRAALEYRHPYFDLRLARWLLAIPELPYAMDKWLLRMALRGMVPETIRTRKKTPLGSDPALAAIKRYGLDAAPPIRLHRLTPEFVDWAAVKVPTRETAEDYWNNCRPVLLNYWFGQEENSACVRNPKNQAALHIPSPSCGSMVT